MKSSIKQKVTISVASGLGLALFILAGTPANGDGGPGFNSQNNPGIQGSQFGRATASGSGTQPIQGGPGFGPGNNPGVIGSAYGRSIASDASDGRSDAHTTAVHSSSTNGREEVTDTDSISGKGKSRGEEEREAHRASPENKGEHGALEKFEIDGKPVLIPEPGVRKNSILYAGITPIPSATASNGINPVPSATATSRDSFTPGVSPIPSATASRGVDPVPSATMSPRP
jgi:hypothetical protein